MAQHPFFPDPAFGWVFCGVLVFLTAWAAYVDFRWLVIPKKLALVLLGLGLAFNLVRGFLLGQMGENVWLCGRNGAFVGVLDAFLFALVGFLVGFGLFLVMWVLGVCGGGDVKLFAALGAWLGPEYTFWVLVATLFVLVPLALVSLMWSVLTRGMRSTTQAYSLSKGKKGAQGQVRPRNRLMTYSFPCVVAVALVLLVKLKADLGIVPRPVMEGPVSSPEPKGG